MSARTPWRGLSCLAASGSTSRLLGISPRQMFPIPSRKTGITFSSPLRAFSTTHRLLVPGRGRSPSPQTQKPPTAILNPDEASKEVSEKSQGKADWRIIIQLARNVWPKNSPGVKVRVAGALGLLVAGKLLNVQVPFFFKHIVDSLNVPITESTTVWVLAGASIAGCE